MEQLAPNSARSAKWHPSAQLLWRERFGKANWSFTAGSDAWWIWRCFESCFARTLQNGQDDRQVYAGKKSIPLRSRPTLPGASATKPLNRRSRSGARRGSKSERRSGADWRWRLEHPKFRQQIQTMWSPPVRQSGRCPKFIKFLGKLNILCNYSFVANFLLYLSN